MVMVLIRQWIRKVSLEVIMDRLVNLGIMLQVCLLLMGIKISFGYWRYMEVMN